MGISKALLLRGFSTRLYEACFSFPEPYFRIIGFPLSLLPGCSYKLLSTPSYLWGSSSILLCRGDLYSIRLYLVTQCRGGLYCLATVMQCRGDLMLLRCFAGTLLCNSRLCCDFPATKHPGSHKLKLL